MFRGTPVDPSRREATYCHTVYNRRLCGHISRSCPNGRTYLGHQNKKKLESLLLKLGIMGIECIQVGAFVPLLAYSLPNFSSLVPKFSSFGP